MKQEILNHVRHGTMILATLMTFGVCANASAQSLSELTQQGQLGLGASTSFNYTWIENDVPDSADKAQNSTLFLLVQPELGYFFSDRAQISFNVGYLMRRLQRVDTKNNTNMMDAITDDATTSNDWLFGTSIKYYIDLTERLAFVPGAGLSFYVGSASRPIPISDDAGNISVADETTSTWGGDVNGNLKFSYLVGERTALLAGLDLHFLFGTENISSSGKSLGILNFNSGLNLGLFYFF